MCKKHVLSMSNRKIILKETKMTNKEKLEALKTWLTENGCKFKENVEVLGVKADLYVKYPHIAVRIGDDAEFFRRTKYTCSPFFIRDNDTVEFVIEKMSCCLAESFVKAEEAIKTREANRAKRIAAMEARLAEDRRRKDEKARRAARPKRKRIRIIHAVKV